MGITSRSFLRPRMSSANRPVVMPSLMIVPPGMRPTTVLKIAPMIASESFGGSFSLPNSE